MRRSLFGKVMAATAPIGAAGSFVLVAVAGAVSQTAPETRTVAVQPTNWSKSLTFPKFDSTLGRLDSVTVTARAEIKGGGRMENLGPSDADITLELSATVELDTLDPTTVPAGRLRLAPLQTRAVTLAGFDGTIDFAGPSGIAFSDLGGSADAAHTSTDPAVLSLFNGPGTLTLNSTAVAASRATGSGNLISAFSTDAGVPPPLSIVYTYKTGHVVITRTSTKPTVVVTRGSPTAAIVYDITVTNDGELPLEKVPVADANVNAAACNQTHSGVLPVAGTWTYQCTSTVAIVANPPTGGQVETNTAVATAKADSNTLTAQSTAVVTLLVPNIALTKTADTPTVAAGAPVSFTLVVSNTGNVDLTNVLVSDPSVFSCNTVIAVLGAWVGNEKLG